MPVTVTMPQLGETVTEGTILSWSKQVGERIAEDETLVEISTDKVDTEMPSPVSGTVLEILVAAGDTVTVGTPLVVIGDPDEAPIPATGEAPDGERTPPEPEPVPAMGPTGMPAMGPTGMPATTPAPPPPPPPPPAPEAAPPAPPSPGTPPPPAPAGTGRRPILSPVVRKLVAEYDVDLDRVTGTGEGGRITRKDVERHIAEVGAAPQQAPVGPVAAGGEPEAIPRLRRTIAEHMIRAKQTAAHVWTSVEVDYEQVERVRSAHRDAFKASTGVSLTYLPFIARATIDALAAYPVVNSSFDLEAGTRTIHRGVNLGIAVDLDTRGLLVATVRGADGRSLTGLARAIRTVADKARDGELEPDDVVGSTFTITNPGPFGSYMSAPIINLPNVAILSTDTVVKRPVVVTLEDGTDTIAIRHIGYLGLTWDHRAFDGSTATRFLDRIRTNLETWNWDQELQ